GTPSALPAASDGLAPPSPRSEKRSQRDHSWQAPDEKGSASVSSDCSPERWAQQLETVGTTPFRPLVDLDQKIASMRKTIAPSARSMASPSIRSARRQPRDQIGPLGLDQRAHLVVDDVDPVEALDLAPDQFEFSLRQHTPAEGRL